MSQTSARTDRDESARLAALRRGDERAYEDLIRSFGPRLLATTRRLLSNEDDATDAVQETFLSAYRALDKFDGKARIYTWLHRIATNAALMKLRRRSRKPESSIEEMLPAFDDTGHFVEPPRPWSGPVESAERGETRSLVRDAIERLPDNYRTVLVLRDIEELDTSEVADILEITTNAVKVRLHRARLALRQLLDPHFQEVAL